MRGCNTGKLSFTLIVLMAIAAMFASDLYAAAPETIKVLGRANTQELEWLKKTVADFEKENPNIKVTILTDAGTGYVDKLTVLWAAGDPPDVWGFGGPVSSYIHRGWLLDLAPYVIRDQAEMNLSDFFGGAWNTYQRGDNIWAIPFITMPSPLWYNADILEECGLPYPPNNWDDTSWTWSKMEEYARKMLRIAANGQIARPGIVIPADCDLFDPVFSRLWGGDWFDEQTYKTGVPNKCILSSAENERGYQAAVRLRLDHGSFSTNTFLTGKAGMYMGVPWGFLLYTKKVEFRWGMASLPRGTHQTAIISTDPWMISSATKHPEAAWKFVKHLTSSQVMEDYSTFSIFPPARRSALMSYLVRQSKASQHHKPQEILECLAGGQKYGRESLDHILLGWRPELESIQKTEFPFMWSGTRNVKEVLIRVQDAINAKIKLLAAQGWGVSGKK